MHPISKKNFMVLSKLAQENFIIPQTKRSLDTIRVLKTAFPHKVTKLWCSYQLFVTVYKQNILALMKKTGRLVTWLMSFAPEIGEKREEYATLIC